MLVQLALLVSSVLSCLWNLKVQKKHKISCNFLEILSLPVWVPENELGFSGKASEPAKSFEISFLQFVIHMKSNVHRI